MTKIDQYHELLAAEGYRPNRDDAETCIAFKVEGKQYLLQLFEQDPDYVRVLSLWALADETTIEAALRVASVVNLMVKAVKTTVIPDDRSVVFSFEALYEKTAHAARFLTRSIDLIDSARWEFFKRARGAAPHSNAAAQETTELAD